MLLLVFASQAICQQPAGATDAEINQVRQEIVALQKVKPPPGKEAQHQGFIDDKLIRLHALLQAKREALVVYLESVKKLIPSAEAQKLKDDVLAISSEMDDVKGALGLSGSSMRAPLTNPTPDVGIAGAGTGTQPPDVPAAAPEIIPLSVEDARGAIASTVEASKPDQPLSGCGAVNSTAQFSRYEQAVCDLVEKIRGRKRGHVDPDPVFNESPDPKATLSRNLDVLELQTIIAARLIGLEERGKFLLAAQEARTDQQVGGGPGNSGSTSLVVKGGAPAALGFAVENGALIQSRSGTTVTFRGNPMGLIRLLGNKGFDTSYIEDEKTQFTQFLKKTSFSVSFDTSRGDDPGVLTANRQQVSGYSARIEFFNQRDPRHPKYQTQWAKFLAEQGVDFTSAIASTYKALLVPPTPTTPFEKKFRDPALEKWFAETEKLLSDAMPDELEGVLKSQLNKFPKNDALAQETRGALDVFAKSFSGYLTARKKLLDEIAKGSVLSFEYTNSRVGDSPHTSNLNFIAATGAGRRIDLTANGSLTFFDKRPALLPTGTRPNRIRDFQFAGQVDVPFGNVTQAGQFDWWASFRYERLLTDASTIAGTIMPNTRGDVFFLQSGLKIPIKGLGIQFPVSITYSNRTELVHEKEIRGNFGFTFNWDTLWARLKPF
jgi:hypothetical protein